MRPDPRPEWGRMRTMWSHHECQSYFLGLLKSSRVLARCGQSVAAVLCGVTVSLCHIDHDALISEVEVLGSEACEGYLIHRA